MDINEINIKNQVCDVYFNNSIEAKKIETRNILVNEKNFKDLVICFTRYVNNKSIKTLRLHYDELIGKTEEHEGKKYLIVDDYMLDIVLKRFLK